MSAARGGCAAAALGQQLYVVGGHDGFLQPVPVVECLDARRSQTRSTWRSAPPMPTGRFGLAVAAAAGRLYAVGGHDGRRRLATAEVFDPATGHWSTLEPMPTARYECAAVAAWR